MMPPTTFVPTEYRLKCGTSKLTRVCRTENEDYLDPLSKLRRSARFLRVIYLHEWDGKPFYWGKANNSFFGGGKRERDGLKASARYNAGYRHWIEGCLRHGGALYIGRLDDEAITHIDEIENYLIHTYGQEMNTRVTTSRISDLAIQHEGDVPLSISACNKGSA